MRVESGHPCKSGGWYHSIPGAGSSFTPRSLPPKRKPSSAINCASLLQLWRLRTPEGALVKLAEKLGVWPESLAELGACFAAQYDAWAFPMRDGNAEVVGIRLRSEDARKWTVTGTRSGIFIDSSPQGSWAGKAAYIVEGPTDTAAAITLGLHAIGKPSCSACNDYVKAALKRLKPRQVIIIADRDEEKINPATGQMLNIGILEAKKLKDLLPFKTLICPPPAGTKDLREFLSLGGTAELIESLTKAYIW
jgi:hypothetical protein